jgi:hypothetical protein
MTKKQFEKYLQEQKKEQFLNFKLWMRIYFNSLRNNPMSMKSDYMNKIIGMVNMATDCKVITYESGNKITDRAIIIRYKIN